MTTDDVSLSSAPALVFVHIFLGIAVCCRQKQYMASNEMKTIFSERQGDKGRLHRYIRVAAGGE